MTQQHPPYYQRSLHMQLPPGQSIFLWGARKTGKSTYLKQHFSKSKYFNLLETDVYFRLLKQPHLLREEILALDAAQKQRPVVIDEIQKIPSLLDEVHNMIENHHIQFILCGSSARKLKRAGVNLLGGRAWRQEFYPLVYPEIPDFDLLQALNRGLLPSHYSSSMWRKSVKAYIHDYLKEEIKAEGLTRNLRAFAEFLDAAAFCNGELINYSNIATDCGVDAKTVKEYFQILVDTLVGYVINPYRDKAKRSHLVTTPKFYFFDVGVVNGITKRHIESLKGMQAGQALEHYILMELIAYRGLKDYDFNITYWRTNAGLEVDFILGNAEVAIEIKIHDRLSKQDYRGLNAFAEAYHPKRSIIINTAPQKRIVNSETHSIEIYPWQQFLDCLWAGEIISE